MGIARCSSRRQATLPPASAELGVNFISMNEIKRNFIEFTKTLANNECSYELWQKFAVAHYAETEIESARIELVRICNDEDSIGNEIWPLSEEAINKIKQVLVQLEGNHS